MLRYSIVLVSLFFLTLNVPAWAEGPPTNGELFEMMKSMQDRLTALEAENKSLRQRLAETGDKESTASKTPGLNMSEEIAGKDKQSGKPNDGALDISVGTTAYYVMGDVFTYVRPGSSNVGTNGTGESTDSVGHEWVPSLDIAVTYDLPESAWFVSGDVSFFDSSESASYTADAANTIMTGFGLASDVSSANDSYTGNSELSRIFGGLNAGYDLLASPHAAFCIEMGLRAGELSHLLNIAASTGELFENNMRFFGMGPRVGVSGSYTMGDTGLSLWGSAGGTLLGGYSQMLQSQENESIMENGGRVVPVLDMRLAGAYEQEFKSVKFSIELGLKAEHWTNLAAWYTTTHNMSVNPSKSDADSISFAGPYAEFKASF